MAKASKPNELYLTREYDAPAAAVWEAWTDPEQVEKWWGPRGFTLTTHKKDLRPGGTWEYTMHGPDGVDYENKTTYFEVEKCARLVYDHGANDDRGPLFRVTVLFSESNGKTGMELTMTLPSPESAVEARKFIKKAGGDATWDRLAEHLAAEKGQSQFFITRSFDGSIETLFEMWTDPNHFKRWLPPVGFEMDFVRAQIETGGSAVYVMRGGNMTMYGRVTYREIRRPDRLVYEQQFLDEKENVARHPFAATWPETVVTTVRLTEEGPDQTRVTVIWEPDARATAAEVAEFMKARPGMTQGWTGSLDKLEACL